MIITVKGEKYIETPCQKPPLDNSCQDCDLYLPMYPRNKCMKGDRDPRCFPSERPDGLWVVFKKVVKQ